MSDGRIFRFLRPRRTSGARKAVCIMLVLGDLVDAYVDLQMRVYPLPRRTIGWRVFDSCRWPSKFPPEKIAETRSPWLIAIVFSRFVLFSSFLVEVYSQQLPSYLEHFLSKIPSSHCLVWLAFLPLLVVFFVHN